jgi:hypothetical protein
MKNLKRSKKIYNWTAKQKSKKRSKKPRFHNAPKDYCKPYWEEHKAREKKEIARFKQGVDEGFLNFPYHHKNSATWDYW